MGLQIVLDGYSCQASTTLPSITRGNLGIPEVGDDEYLIFAPSLLVPYTI
jgi:hypothetical protein